MSRYPIPKNRVRVEHRAGNSRFIATLQYADTVEAARACIQEIHDEMPDATHHVYAYKIGYGGSITEGMSDDGEPSGTSGPPALAVLRGADVGDTVIVITRYFGGTKLGTGGLVAAYGASAKLVIAAMETIEKVDRVLLRIQIPYALQERVRTVFETCDALIETTEYASEVTYTLQLPCDVQSQFSEAVKNLSAGACVPEIIES